MEIDRHLSGIVLTVATHIVSAIEAPTGSGKSLGIPYALTLTATSPVVMVSVPTKAAAWSLAAQQKRILAAKSANASPVMQARLAKIGVGSAAESKIDYTGATKIIYATAGHVRERLLALFSDKEIKDFDFADILIVDEAHTGSVDNFMIISLWRHLGQIGKRVPRLVISSATLGEVDPGILPGGEIFKYIVEQERRFPVQIDYHSKSYPATSVQLLTDTVVEVSRYISESEKGDVLIFVAGEAEAVTIKNKLKDAVANIVILMAYSSLKSEELQKIYEPVGAGLRKVVVATNIAESALTINDLWLVVDTMKEKRVEVVESTQSTRLHLHNITKNSARQRAGRVGRTAPGVCKRMITQEDYENLEEKRPEDITRVPIYNEILALKVRGLDPLRVFSPPLTKEQLEAPLKLLRQIGMLDEIDRKTPAGDYIRFPFEAKIAAVLARWIEINPGESIFPVIVALSAIDGYNPRTSSFFRIPRQTEAQGKAEYDASVAEHIEIYYKKYIGRDDVETIINVVVDLIVSIGGLSGKEDNDQNSKKIKKWADTNTTSYLKALEVLRTIRKSLKIAEYKPFNFRRINTRTDQLKIPSLLKSLKPVFSSVYTPWIMEKNPRGDRYLLERKSYALDRSKESISQLRIILPRHIVAISFSDNGFINLGMETEIHSERPKVVALERKEYDQLLLSVADNMSLFD